MLGIGLCLSYVLGVSPESIQTITQQKICHPYADTICIAHNLQRSYPNGIFQLFWNTFSLVLPCFFASRLDLQILSIFINRTVFIVTIYVDTKTACSRACNDLGSMKYKAQILILPVTFFLVRILRSVLPHDTVDQLFIVKYNLLPDVVYFDIPQSFRFSS